MDKLDAVLRAISLDDVRRMPEAHRQRLAQKMRELASTLDPGPDAPARALEALMALRCGDFDTMYPLQRAGFAAICRRWAQVAEPRPTFGKGRIRAAE